MSVVILLSMPSPIIIFSANKKRHFPGFIIQLKIPLTPAFVLINIVILKITIAGK